MSLALTLTLVGCDSQPTNTGTKPQTTTQTQKEPDKVSMHQIISDSKKYSQELGHSIELVPGSVIQTSEYEVSDVVIDENNETTIKNETTRKDETKATQNSVFANAKISPEALAKLEFGLCKGKKLYDKRDDLAKKDAKREIEREFKARNN